MVFLEDAPRIRIGWLLLVAAAEFVLPAGFTRCCRATVISCTDPVEDHAPGGSIELRAGLTISTTRQRRSAVDVDPIAAQIVTGTWKMPRSGDSVAFPGSQTKTWEPVKAGPDGSFSGGSLRGGYLAAAFSAADDAVMMLETAGNAMVYASGEPRWRHLLKRICPLASASSEGAKRASCSRWDAGSSKPG